MIFFSHLKFTKLRDFVKNIQNYVFILWCFSHRPKKTRQDAGETPGASWLISVCVRAAVIVTVFLAEVWIFYGVNSLDAQPLGSSEESLFCSRLFAWWIKHLRDPTIYKKKTTRLQLDGGWRGYIYTPHIKKLPGPLYCPTHTSCLWRTLYK